MPPDRQPPGRIPFVLPHRAAREAELMTQALESGHWQGDGPFTRTCEGLIASLTGARRALLTTSCTDALEMAAMLLRVGPGDEVVVPSFTFVSTALAFSRAGARIRFCDIDPVTLGMSPGHLSTLVGPRTRVVVPVHYAGVACDIAGIIGLARSVGAQVVEDAAHAFLGHHDGMPLGSFGDLATLSFHATKNIACGEGGALLVNRPDLVERAEILREKGTDRSRFFRGQVDKYTWVDEGSSFLPSDLSAALLQAQLEDRERIQERRLSVWRRYAAELAAWAAATGVGLPAARPEDGHPCHLFHLLLPTPEGRDRFIAHMRAAGIECPFHYVPLHDSPMGRRHGGGDCPVTTDIAARLCRLPLHSRLDGRDVDRIIATAHASMT